MATRNKKTKTTARRNKRTTKKKSPANRAATVSAVASALDRLERQLPPRLADYIAQLQARLDRLEKQIQQAQDTTMQRATRLLREASRNLGRLEVRGESGWERLSNRYRAEAVRLLRRLEKAIAPVKTAGKKSARKKSTRKAAKKK